jgi:hypothetical protein
MTIQLSVAVRNARLDAIETTIGVSAKLQMWSGSMPTNCAASSTGVKLVEDALASDWAASAASGNKSFNNTPIVGTGLAIGVAGYFRLVDTTGVTCHMQGTISEAGEGGDMIIDDTSITTGEQVNVTSFVMTDGNA